MKVKTSFSFLLLTTVLAAFASLFLGAVDISVKEVYSSVVHFFNSPEQLTLNERIFLEIRLPRTILTLLVGASLAVGGVLMQGLFLNPIVEPGLVGTTSGAAFGAALYFTLGSVLNFNAGEWTLPIAACIGGMAATFMVYGLAENKKRTKSSIVALLLIGIAINALFLSAVGFLSYIARDPQARSITFWNLGTTSGASWNAVFIVGLTSILCISLGIRYAKQLNALMLGETEAGILGINIRSLKIKVLLINVVLVSVATAFTGVIGFIGLVVPHLVRITLGSNTRTLILSSVLLGAILLSAADIMARLVIAPAELPIGIVTTVVGVPVFIYLLRKKEYFF